MEILDTELSAISDTSVTLAFVTVDEKGTPNPQDVDILLIQTESEKRRVVCSPGETVDPDTGARVLLIEEMTPHTEYCVRVRKDGAEAEMKSDWFPERFRTLPTPPGALLTKVATISDLHFGEQICGLGPSGNEKPVFYASETDPPYWHFMNMAIIDEINKTEVDSVIVKGDLTGEGLPTELEAARTALHTLKAPWYAMRGNHDAMQKDVNPLSVLGQSCSWVRSIIINGVGLLLADSVDDGKAAGIFPSARLEALSAELAALRGTPTLCFSHHYISKPQPEESKTFGIQRKDSLHLLNLLQKYPDVAGWFAGHTHRNRVRFFQETGAMPHAEVCATKEYPGGWGFYRIYEGGYIQELRRCTAPIAAGWCHRTKDMYSGLFRRYAMRTLPERCFLHLFP